MCTSVSRPEYRFQQLFTLSLIVFLFLVLPGVLVGQAYFGTVGGQLTDSSGAVLAHANVVLTDQQKHWVVPVPVGSAGGVFDNGGDVGVREDGASEREGGRQ
jgi:hypothetical protein